MENHKDWRERLDQNEAPMDTGKFWDSLESKIPAKQSDKKRRRFLFWMLVFIIGSGVTIGGILLMRTENQQVELANRELQVTTFDKLEEKMRSNNISEKFADGTQDETATAEIITQNHSSFVSSNHNRSEENLQNKKKFIEGSKAITSLKAQASMTNELMNVSQNASSSIAENNLKVITVAPELEYNQNPDVEKQNVSKTADISKALKNSVSLDYLPTLKIALISELKRDPASMPAFDNFQKIKLKKSGWQYWMDLSYGIGIGQHSFSTSDPIIQSYLDNRSNHETTLESRLAAWENRLIHPSGFYVAAGLRYQSHFTRFDWSKEETKLEWKLADGFVQDAQGNQIAIRDSAWQQYHELREIQHHNAISTLDIPLNIGYIIRKNRFSVEVAAGITANITQYTSGKQLNMDAQPVQWNATEELTFKKFSTGFGASAMVRASWYPTEYVGVFIQPSFHKDFSNRMISGAGYQHRIDFLNIQAGVAFLMFGGVR